MKIQSNKQILEENIFYNLCFQNGNDTYISRSEPTNFTSHTNIKSKKVFNFIPICLVNCEKCIRNKLLNLYSRSSR